MSYILKRSNYTVHLTCDDFIGLVHSTPSLRYSTYKGSFVNADNLSAYCCPITFQPLTLKNSSQHNQSTETGVLQTATGACYPITDGIPDFTFPHTLAESDQIARDWYDENAYVYDDYLPITFLTFDEDETQVRRKMVSLLKLKQSDKVLEVGCGTGRDSEIIIEHLGKEGKLYLQDLSKNILIKCRERLSHSKIPLSFSVGNAAYLPFPDNFFDATFHFGGLNTFHEIKRSLSEMARVTKIGGKVVIGDESVPPWLRETRLSKILMHSNPNFRYPLPLDQLPTAARSVHLQWIIGGMFYLIDFEVGDGDPVANLDIEIPGVRGGTHRTRYEGQLEGVSPLAKKLALTACEKSGKSMYQWLNNLIIQATSTKQDLPDFK